MRTKSPVSLLPLVLLLSGFLLAQANAAWVREADVTGQPTGKPVKGGGGITAIHDTVYLIVGNNTLDVMKYSIGGNTWTALNPGVPIVGKNKRVKKGACIVDDGEKVYVFKGGGTDEFYCYDPGTGLWNTLPSGGFTKGVKGGFATYAKMAGGEYIYVGSGSNTSEWKRYNITSGAWEAANPASLPAAKVKVGSGIAFEDGKMYFLFAGGKEANFYVADLEAATPTWTAKTALPAAPPAGKRKKVKEGGCLQFLDGRLYAVKGGSTKQFWSYDPLTDVWAYVGEVGDGAATKGIKCGTSLAEGGDGLFCIIGNNTNEFWYYTPPGAKRPAPEPGVAGRRAAAPELGFSVVPNPARGLVRVSCPVLAGRPVRLQVRDVSGRLVRSLVSGTGSYGPLSLPDGVYSLVLTADGLSAEQTLVMAK
jgi:hypothetical protein